MSVTKKVGRRIMVISKITDNSVAKSWGYMSKPIKMV